MINGLPCNQNIGFGAGVADTEDTVIPGIKSGDNLLAVISWTPAGVFVGQDKTDFTVAAGMITGATIDLSAAGTRVVAIWTDAPDS